MRTSQTLIAVTLTAFAMSLAPAVAESPESETVTFEIEMEAPASDIYDTIRQQAWTACAPERLSSSVTTRANVQRRCQNRLVRRVVASLGEPAVTEQARLNGVTIIGNGS
ncbi:MAG: hypothetical protein QNI84_01085 [Henriciella sp.]|nr:hypothetical protein [Henriciella sp.]